MIKTQENEDMIQDDAVKSPSAALQLLGCLQWKGGCGLSSSSPLHVAIPHL